MIYRLNHSRYLFVLAAMFFFAATLVFATTTKNEDLPCPVCGTMVKVSQIMSSNNFGGVDPDFLEHSGGANPVLMYVGTCRKCHFSGSYADFKKSVAPDVKKKIADEHALHPKGDLKLASVRNELMAQMKQLEGAGDAKIADWNLRAAWAVRLEDDSLTAGAGNLTDEDRKWLDEEVGELTAEQQESDINRALEVNRRMFAKLEQLPEDKRPLVARLLASMLRMHGEIPLLLEEWPKLEPYIRPDGVAVKKSLDRSIELEAGYQREARKYFIRALAAKDGKIAAGQRGPLTYLCGELSRRLGDPQQAAQFYERALAEKDSPEWIAKLVAQQRARLGK